MSIVLKSTFLATFVILVAVPGLDVGVHASAHDSGAWQKRFVKEASSAWDQYEARAKRLQGSLSLAFVPLTPEKRVETQRHAEFKQRDGCALCLYQSLVERQKEQRTGELWIVNPRYGFELRRQSPTGPWAISQVDTDLSDELPFPSPKEEVDRWSRCPFSFGHVFRGLGVISRDPTFTLKQVTSTVREGREWAKVEFACSPQGNPRVPSVTGWVVFDPEHYWVIREYDVQMEWPALPGTSKVAVEATHEYEITGDGFPLVKRIMARYKNPSKSYESEHTYEFDLREADVPESEFTLSAFGFPEHPGAPKAPTRWYVWAAFAAIICLGLAVLFRRLARRAERSAELGMIPKMG